MICENKKNNKHCRGIIKGRIKYINKMRVCDRCFYIIKKERKQKS